MVLNIKKNVFEKRTAFKVCKIPKSKAVTTTGTISFSFHPQIIPKHYRTEMYEVTVKLNMRYAQWIKYHRQCKMFKMLKCLKQLFRIC